ncbi:MAG: cation:proton antiporter [Rhodospirillaceae bacterium]|nr:cation:proton antiporter [Rhodospirillaceae bacterium]
MAANLPALQVVLPLAGAPICAILGRRWYGWLIATALCWATFAISVLLYVQVAENGPISYMLGNWMAPWGIEYRLDRIGALVLIIVSGIAAVSAPFAFHSVHAEIPEDQHRYFYTAFLLAMTGLLGMAITGDVFNLFVFLEISSLSSYALISLGRDRKALFASFQYLILGTIGATFIVIGIGLIYMMTGTLNMADLAVRLPAVAGNRVVDAGFVFILVGVAIKLAVFPLHLWLPNAYAYAPSVVSAFLAATATKVAAYMMFRFVFTVFGVEFSFDQMQLSWLLVPLALIAAVTGSLVAIFQDDLKRLLAYSSVAQIGYIVLGIGLATQDSVTAAVVHLFNHALMKGALFMALGAVMLRVGSVDINAIRGLGARMPLTMAAIVIGGLSLIGVPATVGFITKWYLVIAALETGWWEIAVIVLFSSLLAIIYVWRIVEAAYFSEPSETGATVTEAPWPMVASTWVLAAACLYFGLDTRLPVGAATEAARALLGGTP